MRAEGSTTGVWVTNGLYMSPAHSIISFMSSNSLTDTH